MSEKISLTQMSEEYYDVLKEIGNIGAGNATTVMGCTVTLTGIMREYNSKQYFNPKDLTVDKKSGIATIAGAGVAYAGSLD